LTHCDARHQIRDFCGQIAPPRPLPGQKSPVVPGEWLLVASPLTAAWPGLALQIGNFDLRWNFMAACDLSTRLSA
jgi:hypothetical protein